MVEACFLYAVNSGEGLGERVSTPSSLDSTNHKTQSEEYPSYYYQPSLLSDQLLFSQELDLLFPKMILGISTTLKNIITLLIEQGHTL